MTIRLHRPQDGGAPVRALRPAGAAPEPRDPLAALRAAAAAVREGQALDGSGTLRREDAAPLLDWLVAAIEDATRGTLPGRGGPAANPLGIHLISLLRVELLNEWRDAEPPPDLGEVIDLLGAIEEVRLAIGPDWSTDFPALLEAQNSLDLVVGLAHDLRSPLTSVLFLAETLGRGSSGAVTPLQRRQLQLIYSAAHALNSLANDVIELARGGERLVEKETEVFSLAELFEWLRDMVLPIAEEKGVEVRYHLPPTDRRIGRPLALGRVLLNLLTNGLKFTEKGFVEVSGVAKGHAGVEFSVRDTGHGINPETAATLFEPLARRHGPSRRGSYRFSGTGLGLALSRKLVSALGSELKYESRPDWGTRFYFQVELPPASRL